jgi:hypothetical protein
LTGSKTAFTGNDSTACFPAYSRSYGSRSIRSEVHAIRAFQRPIITNPFAFVMPALICAPSYKQPETSMSTVTFKDSILSQVASISGIVIAAVICLVQVVSLLQ